MLFFNPRSKQFINLFFKRRYQKLPSVAEGLHSVRSELCGCCRYIANTHYIFGGINIKRPKHARRREQPRGEFVGLRFGRRASVRSCPIMSEAVRKLVTEQNMPKFMCYGKAHSPFYLRVVIDYLPVPRTVHKSAARLRRSEISSVAVFGNLYSKMCRDLQGFYRQRRNPRTY